MKHLNFVKLKLLAVFRLTDEFFIKPFFGIFSRLFFGNNAGLVNNIIGSMKVHSETNISLGKSKHFQVLKRNDERTEILNSIAVKVEAIFKDHPSKFINTGGKAQAVAQQSLINPVAEIPELKLLLDEEVLQFLQRYYRYGYEVKHVRLWRNNGTDVDAEKINIFSNQWHNDQFETSRLKLFFYLTSEVTREHGPTNVFDLSASKKLMRSLGYLRRGWYTSNVKKLLEDEFNCKLMEGGRGDAFFLNATRILHRAGVPKVGFKRDLIQFEFIGRFSQTKLDLFEKMKHDNLHS